MAITKTATGLITVSGSFRETLSGEGTSNGPVMTFTNGITLKSDNLSGWLNGVGTVTGGTPGTIDLLDVNDPFGTMGDAEFQPGFNPTIDGSYLIGVYFQVLGNDTGDGYGRGSATKPANSLKFQIFYGSGSELVANLCVVGDCYIFVNQNFFLQLAASFAKVRVTLTDVNGDAASLDYSATFRACFFYRKNQYAIK